MKICVKSFLLIHISINLQLLHCNCRYIAAIEGVVSKRHLLAISEGTSIDGVHCTPDSVELLPQQPDMPRPRLRIVVLILCSCPSLFYHDLGHPHSLLS